MEEYFTEEHADTCKINPNPNPFARLVQANTAPSLLLVSSAPPTPPPRPRVSWGVLPVLLSSRASSQREQVVTCCNLAYFESSSPAPPRRHQQSQPEGDEGPSKVEPGEGEQISCRGALFLVLGGRTAECPAGSPAGPEAPGPVQISGISSQASELRKLHCATM